MGSPNPGGKREELEKLDDPFHKVNWDVYDR